MLRPSRHVSGRNKMENKLRYGLVSWLGGSQMQMYEQLSSPDLQKLNRQREGKIILREKPG